MQSNPDVTLATKVFIILPVAKKPPYTFASALAAMSVTAEESVALLVCVKAGKITIGPVTKRISRETLAKFLNTSPDAITYLVENKIIKPCGQHEGTKKLWFPTLHILAELDDPEVLEKVTNGLYEFSENKYAKALANKAAAEARKNKAEAPALSTDI